MCKAKSKSLSNYVPHLFSFFSMQEFKYDLQDFWGEFHCTKAPKMQKEDIVGAKLWYISL